MDPILASLQRAAAAFPAGPVARPAPAARLRASIARRHWRSPVLRPLLVFGGLAVLLVVMLHLVTDNRRVVHERMARGRIYGHTLEVLLVGERLRAQVGGAIEGERGYLLSHDEAFLSPMTEARARLPLMLARLASLTADNRDQRRPVHRLRFALAGLMQFLESEVALERSGGHRVAVDRLLTGEGARAADEVAGLIDAVVATEERLLVERSAALGRADQQIDGSLRTVWWLAMALLASAFAAGIAAIRAQHRAQLAAVRLRLAATTDALTGLYNRRAFFNRLGKVLGRKPTRHGAPELALAMIDIDHFKAVNDRYGHPGGDQALRAVGQALRRSVRAEDFVARIGGEEFAILIDGLGPADAEQVCEQLRTLVAHIPIELDDGRSLLVTLSVGLATRQPGEGGEELIARADRALYLAKAAGRNRVRLAA